MNAEEIKSKLQEVWFEGSPECFACEAIVEFLESSTKDTKRITLALLFQLVSSKSINDKNSVLKAVRYLSGTELNLLEMRFEYFGENEEPQQGSFDLAEVSAIRTEGKYLDPETGVEVFDLDDRFHCYFVPSELAKSIFAAGVSN